MDTSVVVDKILPFIQDVDKKDFDNLENYLNSKGFEYEDSFSRKHLLFMSEKIKEFSKEALEVKEALKAYVSSKKDIKYSHFIDGFNRFNKINEKQHRWVGYLQAMVVMQGKATLDDMKNINKSA